MEIFEIPLSNQDPAFEFTTSLDNQRFIFDYKFNTRLQLWTVNMLDRDGNTIVNGIPFYSGRRLLSYTTAENLLNGSLFILNANEIETDANRFDFGLEVKKLYVLEEGDV